MNQVRLNRERVIRLILALTVTGAVASQIPTLSNIAFAEGEYKGDGCSEKGRLSSNGKCPESNPGRGNK